MSQRITQKDLEHLVMLINKATGSPTERYTKDETGRHTANPGNYHLSYAYGGVALEQLCNPSGGCQADQYRWIWHETRAVCLDDRIPCRA